MLLTVESNFWQKMQNHEFVLILKEMKCLRRQQFLFFGPQFDKKARNIIVVSIWTCAWDLTFSWNNKLTLTNSWQSLAIIQTALLHPPTSIFNQLLAIYVSSIRITGMEEGLKFWRRGLAVHIRRSFNTTGFASISAKILNRDCPHRSGLPYMPPVLTALP